MGGQWSSLAMLCTKGSWTWMTVSRETKQVPASELVPMAPHLEQVWVCGHKQKSSWTCQQVGEVAWEQGGGQGRCFSKDETTEGHGYRRGVSAVRGTTGSRATLRERSAGGWSSYVQVLAAGGTGTQGPSLCQWNV